MKAFARGTVAGVLLLVSWAALPRGEVHGLGMKRVLEALVHESALIARVRVIGTRPERGEFSRCDSIATIEILESFRGPAAGEVVTLRFDTRMACPSVRYEAGEVCLLFAGLEIDGTYFTVNYEDGKKPVSTAEYPSLVQRIRELCAERMVSRWGSPGAGDLGISLKTNAAPGQVTDADSARVRIEIENLSTEPIALADKLRIDVRQDPGLEQLARELSRRTRVTLIVKVGDGIHFPHRMGLLHKVHEFVLEPGQVRVAEFSAAELWPEMSGRGELAMAAGAGRDLSVPVRLAVDFGEPKPMIDSLTLDDGRERFHPSGPAFRELTASERIARFLARHGAALSAVAVAAALLALLLVLGKGFIGRRRTFPRGGDHTRG